MRGSLATLVTVVALGSACGGDVVGTRASAIIGGMPDPGHPTVGRINGCTATLVGARTVLTAAHCFDHGPAGCFAIAGRCFDGDATLHPRYDWRALTHDVAIVRLRDAPPVAPSPINVAAPRVGQAATIVGFGGTNGRGKDAGVKRRGENRIGKVTDHWLTFFGARGNTCPGDSGAPAFIVVVGVEVVAGVNSNGTPPCGQDSDSVRVDTLVDWIEHAAQHDVTRLDVGCTIAPSLTSLSSIALLLIVIVVARIGRRTGASVRGCRARSGAPTAPSRRRGRSRR